MTPSGSAPSSGEVVVHGADRSAIAHHYDVGNDFFALWLDRSMTYSCALFEGEDDTLEDAQDRKLAHHLARLRLPPGGRLLDVGCGWGSALAAAHAQDPDLELVGLTLSEAQAEVARTRTGGRGSILVEAWQEHRPDRPYDGIVSIGAFEHFVRTGLDRPGRVAAYADFFAAAWSWLSGPGRRLSLQTIALEDQEEDVDSERGEFFTDSVFPASSLPRLGEIVDAAEPWFRIVEQRADPEDYMRTCRAWRTRLHSARHTAESLVGPDAVRHYRKMLMASEMEFASRSSTLHRLVLEARPRMVSVRRGHGAAR